MPPFLTATHVFLRRKCIILHLRPTQNRSILSKEFQNLVRAVHELVFRSHNPQKLKDLAATCAIAAVRLRGVIKGAGIKNLQGFGYYFG